MSIELAAEIPCTELKPLGDLPNIKLLGGAELKALVDLAAGPATDCRLTINLMLQLAPLLASMACLFKILNVISKIQDFATAVTEIPNMKKLLEAVPNLVGAIEDLKSCIPAFQLPQLGLMLKGMLQLLLRFLSCFLSQLDSLLKFRLSIDFAPADGNPVLREALTCAQKSADAAQVNLLKSLEPLKPIMNIVGMVAGVAGVSLAIPDFESMAQSSDVAATIDSVKQAVDALQKVVDGIPG
jgi:hypothetical protein